jgi:hypothetical protein
MLALEDDLIGSTTHTILKRLWKYMYTPGDADAEGMYETTRTKHPPAVHVTTRHVSFDGLVSEREVYARAS